MPVITSEDVAVSLGRPISDQAERSQVDLWISDAELLIRSRLGDLDLLDQQALAYVVREAVLARLRNPEGYQYEAIDDYRYGLPAESRRITIIDAWWRLLQPRRRGRVFSVMPS